MELRIHKDKMSVAKHFSDYFYEMVRNNDITHVALSGGSTPKVIFDILAEYYGDKIDWTTVHFYWGDERCVAPDDDQSNYKMTVIHLFSKVDVPPANIHRIHGESDPSEEALRYATLLESNLECSNDLPQFDLVILGMGDDGHTASIFPHELDLWDNDAHCVVATHPESGQKRVSITGQVINEAKEVIFLVTGDNKAEKIDAIHNQKEGHKQYPASFVNPTSEQLIWYLDEAAAKNLN